MSVQRACSRVTAGRIRGLRSWIINEFPHVGQPGRQPSLKDDRVPPARSIFVFNGNFLRLFGPVLGPRALALASVRWLCSLTNRQADVDPISL
jgi:hypothetical protein